MPQPPSLFGQSAPGPAGNAYTITTSDSTVLARPTRAIYVGGAGDLAVRMADDGSTPIFKAVPVGTVLNIRADKILATGTTATNLLGLY
jgi:hypothetical protein